MHVFFRSKANISSGNHDEFATARIDSDSFHTAFTSIGLAAQGLSLQSSALSPGARNAGGHTGHVLGGGLVIDTLEGGAGRDLLLGVHADTFAMSGFRLADAGFTDPKIHEPLIEVGLRMAKVSISTPTSPGDWDFATAAYAEHFAADHLQIHTCDYILS